LKIWGLRVEDLIGRLMIEDLGFAVACRED
jgi:hypothetical protein